MAAVAPKPGADATTRYSPAFKLGTVYAPTGFVVVLTTTPVAVLVMETVALGTAAPMESAIVPDSVAPATCARNGAAIRKEIPRTPTKSTNLTAFGFIAVSSAFLHNWYLNDFSYAASITALDERSMYLIFDLQFGG